MHIRHRVIVAMLQCAPLLYASHPRLHAHRTPGRDRDHRHPVVGRVGPLNGARKKGRDARGISDLKQIQLALEMYYNSNSSEYPDAASSLASTYISTLPADPQGGAYLYDNLTTAGAACSVSGGVCTSYVLGATLEDDAHSALSSDIDGTVGSVNCADTTGSPSASHTGMIRARSYGSKRRDVPFSVGGRPRTRQRQLPCQVTASYRGAIVCSVVEAACE